MRGHPHSPRPARLCATTSGPPFPRERCPPGSCYSLAVQHGRGLERPPFPTQRHVPWQSPAPPTAKGPGYILRQVEPQKLHSRGLLDRLKPDLGPTPSPTTGIAAPNPAQSGCLLGDLHLSGAKCTRMCTHTRTHTLNTPSQGFTEPETSSTHPKNVYTGSSTPSPRGLSWKEMNPGFMSDNNKDPTTLVR